MSLKKTATKKAAEAVLDSVFAYIDRNPEEGLEKILNYAGLLAGTGLFPAENIEKMKKGVADPTNVYTQYAKNVLAEVDRDMLKKLLLTAGIDAGLFGTREVRENRVKYDCNIPWLILFDPTSACNLKCKGCWAAEYDKHTTLSMREMQGIIDQGRALGTHIYMLTGGEPLVCKKEVLELCENNQDCVFLVYTNGTLVDDAFCNEMKRVGNITLALSIEGNEETNDYRRGKGCYAKVINAMETLHRHGCFYGVSICYTRKNLDLVTSEDFLDLIIEKGAKYAFYFNYMPVGHGADKELVTTPAQRKFMYFWLKKMRNGHTGKPIFVFDFQDDGEYVGGCIAGGRNYFHINSAGDMEPCVFIHYSDSNIREKTLLEALKSPLFTAYRKGQPFNDNHLRPCPMLENPDKLRAIIAETGAKSTDLLDSESVEALCSRCDEFAYEWQGVADEIWATTNHPKTHTMYYRDGGKAKRQ